MPSSFNQVKDELIGIHTFLEKQGYSHALVLDITKPRTIKIKREVPATCIKQVRSRSSLVIKVGNGSFGKLGMNNTGYKTESRIYTEIQNFIDTGTSTPLIDHILSETGETKLLSVSQCGMETMLPRGFDALRMQVGEGVEDIGSKVADIVLTGEKNTHYISLKYGGSFTYANFYVRHIFHAETKDERYYNILNTLGIRQDRFVETFDRYKRREVPTAVPKTIDLHPPCDMIGVRKFLESAWGYGYWHVNVSDRTDDDIYYVSKKVNNDICDIQRYAVAYPRFYDAKRVDIWIQTKRKTYTLNLRNKNGGLLPDLLAIQHATDASFEKFLHNKNNNFLE